MSVLEANAALPAYRRRAYDKTAIDSATGGHAAGVIFVAPDGDILLLRRSSKEENYAGYWALPGGGVEDGETPQLGAARECQEEMGVDVGDERMRDLHKTVTPTGKVYHTFARPTDAKFAPKLNDEHTGFAWASLDMLPRPLHPAIESLLKDRIGVAEDMAPEDWQSLREGFAKWVSEEETEQAHDSKITIDVDDEDGQLKKLLEYIKANSEVGHSFGVVVDPDDRELAKKFYIDGDGAFRIRDITMAMDRDSVREKTRDGRLIVKRTHISKANVCPYRGKEIPGWEALGLDAERVYNLLRDPEELAKAAPTLNGVQLLIKHIPVNADDHRPNETVGSLGSDAEFDGEYLDNSLYVNSKEGIDAIESGRQRELSAGYHYKPDMTAGNFRGTAYDGVMRDIVFNHVALVEDGRAGPDVVVGDEALKENDMKATRFGARTLQITAAAIAPLLAMDSKVTLPKDLFIPLTTNNFKDHRAKLMAGVKLALDGKLKKGLALDGSIEKFGKALDAFIDDVNSGMDEPAPEEQAGEMDKVASVEPPKGIAEQGSTYDAEPMKAYMKQCGMDDEMIGKCMDMMPKPAIAGDADETDEEKAAREKKEAADKAAKDSDMDKDKVSKPAMDAALAAQAADFDKRINKVRDTERAIRLALDEVRPWVGELPATMAFDSAADVHRKACEMKGVDGFKTLHADALMPILKTHPKIGARQQNNDAKPLLAMDAVKKATTIAPGLEHISTQL